MRIFERIILSIFVLVLLVFCAVQGYERLLVDHTPPVIESDSDSITVSVNDPEQVLLQGIRATDDTDGDLTDSVMIQSVSGLIDSHSAKVSYIVFDSSNNMGTYSRNVQYSDYAKPRFSLTSPLVYRAGGSITLLDRLKASDTIDGDISKNIRVTAQNVSANTTGTYTVTVQVTNSMGDTSVLPLTVVINNAVNYQVIHLSEYIVYLEQGADFDPKDYVTDITPNVGAAATVEELDIISYVDVSVPGDYEVRYTYQFPDGERSYTLYQTVIVE